jgi:hypothetical protein
LSLRKRLRLNRLRGPRRSQQLSPQKRLRLNQLSSRRSSPLTSRRRSPLTSQHLSRRRSPPLSRRLNQLQSPLLNLLLRRLHLLHAVCPSPSPVLMGCMAATHTAQSAQQRISKTTTKCSGILPVHPVSPSSASAWLASTLRMISQRAALR